MSLLASKHADRISVLMTEHRYPGSDSADSMNNVHGLVQLVDELPDTCKNRAVEVGSFKGVSSEILAMHFADLTCIDTWPRKRIFDSFCKRMSVYKNVRWMHMDGFDGSKSVSDKSLDFVYIDADHRFMPVMIDILTWRPKLRIGGVIAGHDYGREGESLEGVTLAVNKIFGKPDKVYPDSSWMILI
jgi:predicted O-methyltransferase YrrM